MLTATVRGIMRLFSKKAEPFQIRPSHLKAEKLEIFTLNNTPDGFTEKFQSNLDEGNYGFDDILKPAQQGKLWLFEPLKDRFPRTYDAFIKGGPLMFAQKRKDQFKYDLVIECGKRLIQIGRREPNNSPDELHAEPRKNTLIGGLPYEVQQAFYGRMNGLSVKRHIEFERDGFLLPTKESPTLDHMVERHKLRRSLVDRAFGKQFPLVKPDPKAHSFFYISAFLNTYADDPGKPDSRHIGEYLFVKRHIHDEQIYIVKDGDYKNMLVLSNYIEGLDHYCASVLQNEKGRFDFSPYCEPFEWDEDVL